MSEEMNRFILALGALDEGHKKVERAFARRYGETYPSDEELQAEFDAAYAALPEPDRQRVLYSVSIAYASVAIERFVAEFQKAMEPLAQAFANFGSALAETVSGIDWQALGRLCLAIHCDKPRPQRHPDPVSRAQVRRAIKRLPNTLAVLR